MPVSGNTVVPLIINGKEEIGPLTFNVVSPYTSEACWTATAGTAEDAVRAVDAAQAAFPVWSKLKPNTRRDILLKAADILESRLEENAAFMRTEMGADVGASQFFVVPISIRMLRDIAHRITSICGSVPTVEEDGRSAIVFKEPIGVILGIVPWYVTLHSVLLQRLYSQEVGMLRLFLAFVQQLVLSPQVIPPSLNHQSSPRGAIGLLAVHLRMLASRLGV